jgi:hypothetical protein
MLRLAKNCTSTRERFSLQNWNETNQKDLLKWFYVSGSTLKRPSSEWRPIRNLDTRKAARHYDIAFMQFVSNMESLRPRQGRILPLYSVGQPQPAGNADMRLGYFRLGGRV